MIGRVATLRKRRNRRLFPLDGFDVDIDVDVVSRDKRRVRHSEIAAFDRRRRFEGGMRVAALTYHLSQENRLQRDRPRDAVQRQISGNRERLGIDRSMDVLANVSVG